jgi:hypothetical protein
VAYAKQPIRDKLVEHKLAQYGDDAPESRTGHWGQMNVIRCAGSTGADNI